MVENLSMPDLLKDVILIYFFCRALPLFFSGIAIFTAEHTEIFIYLQIIILSMKSILKCPKCNQEFEYSWIPGGSLSSIRLGKKRYMRCPKCHKFSLFNVGDTRINE